jgi:hypothetical protein
LSLSDEKIKSRIESPALASHCDKIVIEIIGIDRKSRIGWIHQNSFNRLILKAKGESQLKKNVTKSDLFSFVTLRSGLNNLAAFCKVIRNERNISSISAC